MMRNLTCIECPQSCVLSVDIENSKLSKVSGNNCPKGETYAKSEVEDPQRIFTSTVLCIGLDLKMLPVRTNQPIPKNKIIEAGNEVKKIRVTNPVFLGEIIKKNFLELQVDLIATRSASAGR